MAEQCKCGSLDFFMQKQGNNTGLYCSMCGRWQKWLNKNEIRLFEQNNRPKSRNVRSNADRIRNMTDEELAKEFSEDIPCNICEYYNKQINECCSPVWFVCTKGYAEALILQWLKEEAKE